MPRRRCTPLLILPFALAAQTSLAAPRGALQEQRVATAEDLASAVDAAPGAELSGALRGLQGSAPATVLGDVRFVRAKDGDCGNLDAGNLARGTFSYKVSGFRVATPAPQATARSLLLDQPGVATLPTPGLSVLTGRDRLLSLTVVDLGRTEVDAAGNGEVVWRNSLNVWRSNYEASWVTPADICAVWVVRGVREQVITARQLTRNQSKTGGGPFGVVSGGDAWFGGEEVNVFRLYQVVSEWLKLPVGPQGDEPGDLPLPDQLAAIYAATPEK